jgi:hypothetical protein
LSQILLLSRNSISDLTLDDYQIKLKTNFNKNYDKTLIKAALDEIEFDMVEHLADMDRPPEIEEDFEY